LVKFLRELAKPGVCAQNPPHRNEERKYWDDVPLDQALVGYRGPNENFVLVLVM